MNASDQQTVQADDQPYELFEESLCLCGYSPANCGVILSSHRKSSPLGVALMRGLVKAAN